MPPNRVMMLVGYALSVPPLLIFNRVLREQRITLMGAIVAGNALIVAGWATERDTRGFFGRRKRRSTVLNAVSLVVLPAVYVIRGRRLRAARGSEAA